MTVSSEQRGPARPTGDASVTAKALTRPVAVFRVSHPAVGSRTLLCTLMSASNTPLPVRIGVQSKVREHEP